MIEYKTLYEINQGLLSTGIYRCIDLDDLYTLNIGRGYIEVVHIEKGLISKDQACQFAIHKDNLYFRLLDVSKIDFRNTMVKVKPNTIQNFEINIRDLPFDITRELNNIVMIEIINGEVRIIREKHSSKITSPFRKDANEQGRMQFHINPFRNSDQNINEPTKHIKEQEDIQQGNIKLSSNNKNTIFNIKEK